MFIDYLLKSSQNCVEELLFDDRTQKSLDTILEFVSKTDGLCLFVVDQICNACPKVAFRNVFISKCWAKVLKNKVGKTLLDCPFIL
jgi:hypothetical protein